MKKPPIAMIPKEQTEIESQVIIEISTTKDGGFHIQCADNLSILEHLGLLEFGKSVLLQRMIGQNSEEAVDE